jgi:hypothetical protein
MSMIPDETPAKPAPIGHNQPPSPIEVAVAAQREAQTPERKERVAYIVDRAGAKDVVDRETAGQAGDIIKVGRDVEKLIETDRVALTKPYRDAADAAKAECDQFLAPLREALERLAARVQAWSDAEDERIAAQQREQEAFFAPKPDLTPDVQPASPPPPSPAAPVKPARRQRIVGDLGSRVTQAETKTYRVIDVRAVPDFILETETVKTAIAQVARTMGKHMKEIPGIEITVDTGIRVQ